MTVVCVCLLVSFSSFVFASYIISRFMGVWKLYCLSGWAGCLSFIQFTGFSKIFVRQTTHYVPSNICLLLSFSLLLSLLCISMYECTINEYLYRDRCNNRLYLMLLYCVCKSLLFYLIRLFVCLFYCARVSVSVYVWWLNLKISIQNIRLYQKETFSLIIILISWSFFIYIYRFFLLGLIPYSSRNYWSWSGSGLYWFI